MSVQQSSPVDPIAPIELEFEVACPPSRAFAVWAGGIGSWWPADHTVSAEPGLRVVLEPRPGGRIYERTASGTEHDWGEVTIWEPPHRLGYLWHLKRDRSDATEVEIRFTPSGRAETRVEIVHRGWERLGADGESWRDRNRGGWATLLPHFVAAAANDDGRAGRDGPGSLMAPVPAMYEELAGWFHLLTAPAEYEEEAEHVLGLLRASVAGPLDTALELGSGGGNLASHLGKSLSMTLSDLSVPMLELSRSINPTMDHVAGDMRTLRLGRTFDAVIVHDAIMYMTTEDDLRAAIQTAFEHCRPGGAAVLLPDCVRETFAASTDHGGHDEHADGTGRGLRYLEWTSDPDPADSTYQVDYAYLLREADGLFRVVHDRHVEGVFTRATWLRLLAEAGFEPRVSVDPWARDVFVGARPSR